MFHVAMISYADSRGKVVISTECQALYRWSAPDNSDYFCPDPNISTSTESPVVHGPQRMNLSLVNL